MTLPPALDTLPATLAFWAEEMPDAPALIPSDRPPVSYAELWRSARGFAESLRGLGLGRADRIALVLPEGPALAVALLGAASVAAAAPLGADLAPGELTVALRGLRPAAVLSLMAPDGLADCCRELGISLFALCAGADAPALHVEGQPMRDRGPMAWPAAGDAAIVRQTSGTTGRPKWVVRTHGDLVGFGRDQHRIFANGPGDRVPAIAPLSTTLGQTVLVHAVVCGAAVVFPRSPAVSDVWDAIVGERATWLSVAAGFLELLAHDLERRPGGADPSSLRFIQVTAAPISPAVCAFLAARLEAPVLPRYSSTEAGGVALTAPPPARGKPGSAGRPIQEVRIVETGGEPAGPNVVGEIWVRGQRVVPGYLDDPEATAAAFLPGGWYRTGDAGYLDEEGFLFVTGRVDELINRGGSKIAPAEVDQALLAHPSVRDAAAFAVPHARLGEDVVAAVVPRDGCDLTPRELRRWLLDRLSPHKAPRRIWYLDDLPRTATGKVRRGELTRRWRAERG
jgi:acyl-CoA synthetase (AMP-forming)/AMP-acid ligase II